MELSGKLVIITGASKGIGRALAIELARSGCGLLLTALESDELNRLLNELRAFPIKVVTIAADLSDTENRKSVLNWILEHEQPPDILVNNAGIGGQFGRFEQINLNDIEKTIALNVSALVYLTHELIPILRKRPHAKIVNISSGIARLPYPGLAVYGATKAFVSSFTESLTCELAGTNIDVHCFYPGDNKSGSGLEISLSILFYYWHCISHEPLLYKYLNVSSPACLPVQQTGRQTG